ncbi:centromere protein T isoform X2 [Sceloporus undulatus]|uniref:centromere protein T isoform X2 n=1 Tax=Sceloporus undulatus TaxID=8520 RepID=UPI001C4B1BB9|nr:centromere protein T isoform X2 [Sceloporus undulatus]
MSARRAARKKPGTPRRFSLRLENKKNLPFGYQRPTTSMAMESATPRTLLRKVLQTQPIVSPLVSEERTSPKPAEPVRRWSLRHIPCSNLEISLPDSAPKEKCHISRVRPVSKKIRLSEFERGVNNQLVSSTAQPSLENISLTKSLEVSFRTPAPLQSAGRKGLIRRPKNYKGINVKDFEGGIEQNLLHTKESQSYCVDSQIETLLSDAEMHTAATELFAQPQLRRQNEEEVSVAHSHRASIQQSLTGESILASNQTPKQFAKSNGEAEGMESAQKESWTLETESMDEAGIMLKEKIDSPAEEEQESLQDIAGGLLYSSQKKRLTQGYDEVGRVEAVLPESPVTPENVQENLTGNTFMKQLLSTPKHLNTGMGSVRSSTPVQAKVQEAQPGHLSILPHEKPARYSVKEIVTQLIEELDKSVIPTVTGESISEADKEEELFPNEEAIQISQRISTETPTVSKRNTKKLERPPTKEIVDQITQQSGKGGEPQEMLDMETEHNVISEAEMDCEEMSDAETDVEKTDPTVKTPAFVRARAFQCTSLLATPHTLKVSVSRSPIKQHSVKQASKRPERVPRTKHSPALPSSFIKTLFSHYVRMPVAKDAFKAVERCVNLYFKHLSDDLEVYTNHARRKIAEPADVELLMRRQGLITDKTPLNVLIERHLPLEYRKLLIPVATSGNKVIPPKLR